MKNEEFLGGIPFSCGDGVTVVTVTVLFISLNVLWGWAGCCGYVACI